MVMTKAQWIDWLAKNKDEFLKNYFDEEQISTMLYPLASDNRIEFASGCTKFCIIDFDSNFVIKWEYVDEGYMEKEYEIYKKAVIFGIDCFFPKTELLFELENEETGLSIFIQERVPYTMGDLPKVLPDKFAELERLKFQFNEYFDFYSSLNPFWVAKAEEVFGAERVRKLAIFTKKYRINDLHSGNIGFTGENLNPIIFDFSGY